MKIAFNPTSATSIAPGQYRARLSKVIDLGTQASTFDGKSTWQRTIQATWELHGTGVTRGGNPPTASEFYNASMHPKAKLRQHLEASQGREFTYDEVNNFDLCEWINRSCLLTIVAKGKFPKIVKLAPLPNEHAPVPDVAKPVIFNLNDPDIDVYQTLDNGLRAMISASPEWKLVKDTLCPLADESDYSDTLQSKLEKAMAAMNARA